MKKSIYIHTLLLHTLACFLLCQSAEIKGNEKKIHISHLRGQPIALQGTLYEKWGKNRRIIASSSSPKEEVFEAIMNDQDQRKKLQKLPMKIKQKEKPVDITKYIVKIHSDYGSIKKNKRAVGANGTATIIRSKQNIILLLTCAHNLVKHVELDPFNPHSNYAIYYAQNVTFSFEGKNYPCNHCWIHPQYDQNNQSKDIAILVSDKDSLDFPYAVFPDIETVPSGEYEGYVMGFPGEKDKKGNLYGMFGKLNVKEKYIEYNEIDTTSGQSGAAIWANINDIYKIIGVHTTGDTFWDCNCGPLLNQAIVSWIEECWLEAEKVFEKHRKIAYKSSSIVMHPEIQQVKDSMSTCIINMK